MSVIQENSVASAIKNGTIFDDAETVSNEAKYIELTTLPNNAIVNKGKEPLKRINIILSIVVGKMDDEGRCGQCDADLINGNNCCKDILDYKSSILSRTCTLLNRNHVISKCLWVSLPSCSD